MRGSPGFSLVEVLAVLGLLSILMLVTVPQLTVPDTLNVSTAARQIAADFRLAHESSIARRGYYTLEFSPPMAPYTSYTVRNEATLVAEPDFPKDIPAGITVTGRRTFCFLVGGWIDDDCFGPGGVGTDGAVSVAAGANTATIQVFWYTGRVKVVGP